MLFERHKHKWEDESTYREYWYQFPPHWYENYRVYDHKVNWDDDIRGFILSSGVKTAIVQCCTDIECAKYRTQWVDGEYALKKEKTKKA